MKALFIGGIKSGKSLNAEKYTLKHSKTKPIYLATNEFFDKEMSKKVCKHKKQREDKFYTEEEALHLTKIIKDANAIVLVECVSMWINNMLYHNYKEEDITKEIKETSSLNKDIVYVINDVGCSIVHENKLAREFVEINGRVSQLLALKCDEVYHTIAGISTRIK